MTRFYAQPLSTLMFAGFGAEVIRIDEPGCGDSTMTGALFLGTNISAKDAAQPSSGTPLPTIQLIQRNLNGEFK